MKKIIILLIVGLIFISGCARTVTQRPKGYLGISISFYRQLILSIDGSYYAFIIAFNEKNVITEDPNTWQYYIEYDGFNQKFMWGINDFSSYGTLLSGKFSEDGTNFSFKISLNLFSNATSLYMKIFYFVYDPLQGFGDLSWQYPDSGSIRIDLSTYPYSYNPVPTGNIISGLSLWIE
ncbi:hypothetical protein [Dictyoglomus turgidum]|uniref:hypothetical protein n=1 Tax=Dictyoglomus turgidum TaxID=513050 RepID=UPI002357C062|nr:hypothetical protein [Dictyoglomus turgidum]